MQLNFDLAAAHIAALTGDVNSIVQLRAIYDASNDRPAQPLIGRLADLWSQVEAWNRAGYGIFVMINESNGGRENADVIKLRANVLDLDDVATAAQNFAAACAFQPLASFAVTTSPGKNHLYWVTLPHNDHAAYTLTQRKLAARFGGDRQIIDPARVLRLSGTYHMKRPEAPFLVTCHALAGYGRPVDPAALAGALADVWVLDSSVGARYPLGDPTLAAPSGDWARFALMSVDPNSLDRRDWVTVIAAFKQAASTVMHPDTAYATFMEWCARYEGDNPAENLKNWNSIRETEVGWANLSRRSPNVLAHIALGSNGNAPAAPAAPAYYSAANATLPAEVPSFGWLLSVEEQKQWFSDSVFVLREERIYVFGKQLMKPQGFNAYKGGKRFIIDSTGKTTDEAWKAATRGTEWQIPQVDYLRFLPHVPTGEIIVDSLGNKGVNTFKPSIIASRPGDASPFLRHLELLMPDAQDRKIYLDFLAHNIRYPGVKIPWAPVLVSAEGAGKGLLGSIIRYCMGGIQRCYMPSAMQLASSGSQFNEWLSEKLFIIVDEIKVDEQRELIEVLKPLITDTEIEVQGKGTNQKMADVYANWQFHSNYKDAVPINKNGRRYAIFYLASQTADDLVRLGMTDDYFGRFRYWLEHQGGFEIVADWFMRYPIERGSLPGRAPRTSSYDEALDQSLGPVDRLLMDKVEAGASGYAGGYVSLTAFKRDAKNAGFNLKTDRVLIRALESAGFYKLGRAPRPYIIEGDTTTPPMLYAKAALDPAGYGRAQRYE